jgi:hypothetical protein
MANPELKYTYVDGRKASEFVAYEIGEAIIDARYIVHPDGSSAWYDARGMMVASDATETRQVSGSDLGEHSARDQGGQKPSSGSSNRVRKSRKKPEA